MSSTSETVRQSRSKNCMARGCIASTACATSMTYNWSFHHSKLYSLRSLCTSKQSLYIVFMYCTESYISLTSTKIRHSFHRGFKICFCQGIYLILPEDWRRQLGHPSTDNSSCQTRASQFHTDWSKWYGAELTALRLLRCWQWHSEWC